MIRREFIKIIGVVAALPLLGRTEEKSVPKNYRS
jgi:hypothetical protein